MLVISFSAETSTSGIPINLSILALLCIFNFLTLTTNVYTRSTFIYIFSFIAKEDKKLLRSPDEVRVKVPRGMVAMSRLEFVFECMDGCFTSTASHNPPMTQ